MTTDRAALVARIPRWELLPEQPWMQRSARGEYVKLADVLSLLTAEPERPTPPTMADAAEMLWVVLANVSGGDWTKQSAEWQEAAARWRDNYYAALKGAEPERPETPLGGICWCRKNPCVCDYHDNHCERELTSHGYTPCRCDERAGAEPKKLVWGTHPDRVEMGPEWPEPTAEEK
jgi:hypothetical protein